MKHVWNGGSRCAQCGLNREGAGAGPYGAMRYYVDDGTTYSYKPGSCVAAKPKEKETQHVQSGHR